jgi:hypothetical protein
LLNETPWATYDSGVKVIWSSVKDATLSEVGDRLRSVAKPFGSVTMADLVAAEPGESLGLYVFFEGDTWIYVGKASSRAIIERVPSHLDVRPEEWFGTLLKELGKRRVPPGPPRDCVDQALALRLALLVADSPKLEIARAEDAFRHAFRPLLNAPKKPRPLPRGRAPASSVLVPRKRDGAGWTTKKAVKREKLVSAPHRRGASTAGTSTPAGSRKGRRTASATRAPRVDPLSPRRLPQA